MNVNEKLIEEAKHLIEQAGSFREQVGGDASPTSMIGLWLRTADSLAAVLAVLDTATPEPQGEPSDVTLDEIEQRVYDEHRGQIAGMAKALVRAGWDAALRAASAVTEEELA